LWLSPCSRERYSEWRLTLGELQLPLPRLYSLLPHVLSPRLHCMVLEAGSVPKPRSRLLLIFLCSPCSMTSSAAHLGLLATATHQVAMQVPAVCLLCPCQHVSDQHPLSTATGSLVWQPARSPLPCAVPTHMPATSCHLLPCPVPTHMPATSCPVSLAICRPFGSWLTFQSPSASPPRACWPATDPTPSEPRSWHGCCCGKGRGGAACLAGCGLRETGGDKRQKQRADAV
jgi:hypothetical protein